MAYPVKTPSSVLMLTIMLSTLYGICFRYAAPAAAFTFSHAPLLSRTKDSGLMKGIQLLNRKNEVTCVSSLSSERSGQGEWDNDDFLSSLSDTPWSAPPKSTTGRGGRRHRRRVSNTSDLYLEQLKIDSTSRTRARLEGDERAANNIWADPEINAVKERLEPFLNNKRLQMRERFLYTTSPDEMVNFIDEVLDESEEAEEWDSRSNGESNMHRMVEKVKKMMKFMDADDNEEEEEWDRGTSGESYSQRMVEKVNKMDSEVIDAVVTSTRKDGDKASRKSASFQEQPRPVDAMEDEAKSSTVEGAIDVEVLK